MNFYDDLVPNTKIYKRVLNFQKYSYIHFNNNTNL